MAAYGEASMISPPSSISNGQEPSGHLPPLPPPLRSTQVFQPLSVFPVSNLSEDGSYDYVFGGPLQTPPLSSTLKLTSPPIRLRSDDGPHGSNVENGRSYRRSFGYAPKRPRPVVERESNASNKGHGEDEATLRQLLLEFA